MKYEVEICSSIVVLSSIITSLLFLLMFAFQWHIINVIIGKVKIDEEIDKKN